MYLQSQCPVCIASAVNINHLNLFPNGSPSGLSCFLMVHAVLFPNGSPCLVQVAILDVYRPHTEAGGMAPGQTRLKQAIYNLVTFEPTTSWL